MTDNVHTANADMSVSDVAKMMKEHDIGMLPVVLEDAGKVVATVTDRDIVVNGVASGADPKQMKVNDVMTTGVASCYPDDDVDKCAKTMRDEKVRRMVVFERDSDRVCGMVSLGDLANSIQDEKLLGHTVREVSSPA
jgi:CBS domain-containing protein